MRSTRSVIEVYELLMSSYSSILTISIKHVSILSLQRKQNSNQFYNENNENNCSLLHQTNHLVISVR